MFSINQFEVNFRQVIFNDFVNVCLLINWQCMEKINMVDPYTPCSSIQRDYAMRQVVASKRLKTLENYKAVSFKSAGCGLL